MGSAIKDSSELQQIADSGDKFKLYSQKSQTSYSRLWRCLLFYNGVWICENPLSTIPKTLLTMTQNLYSILRYNEGSWPHSIIYLMYCGLKFEHGLHTTTIFQASSFWATMWPWCPILEACTTILLSTMMQVCDFIVWKVLFAFQWIISGVCLNSCVFKDPLYRHEYSTWDSFPFESQASMIFYPVVREDDMRNRWVRKR